MMKDELVAKFPTDAIGALAEGLARSLDSYVSATDCEDEVEAFLVALRKHGWQVSPPAGAENMPRDSNQS